MKDHVIYFKSGNSAAPEADSNMTWDNSQIQLGKYPQTIHPESEQICGTFVPSSGKTENDDGQSRHIKNISEKVYGTNNQNKNIVTKQQVGT